VTFRLELMQCRNLIAVAFLFGSAIPPASALAQSAPESGLYRIESGTYSECCGFSGMDTVYPLPNESQSYVKLVRDSQSGTTRMTFLGADGRTVFTTVPCLPDGAIDFNFPYGFGYGDSLVFHVDPGPPPYAKYWNYTASNSFNGLRIDGGVGTLQSGCVDTPTRFTHSNIMAVFIPPPKLSILEFSTERGARLFIQGNAGETNVIESSGDLINWIPVNTNVMDSSLCPICPYFIFEDSNSTNRSHTFYRVYKLY